jgi:hypothetical protein
MNTRTIRVRFSGIFWVVCGLAAALSSVACVAEVESEGTETSEQALIPVPPAGSILPTFYIDDNGRVARKVPAPSILPLEWEALTVDKLATLLSRSNWAAASSQNTKRVGIVQTGVAEANLGMCGAPAEQRYGMTQGSNWCSEYARSILLWSGFRNIRYCYTHVITCLDYFYLSEAHDVEEMVTLFAENGGWTNRSNTRTTTPRPGDYVALTGSSGKPKSHSAIVLGVSNDFRYIWTSEGNLGDCAGSQRRDFYVDGVLDSKINGFGNASIGL